MFGAMNRKPFDKPVSKAELAEIMKVDKLASKLNHIEFLQIGLSVIHKMLVDKGFVTQREIRQNFIYFAKELAKRKGSTGKT